MENIKGVSAEAQRARILAWLEKKPLDTVEAYVELGCLHAPRRLMELRRAGHPIAMRWIHRHGPEGARHRVGQYYLDNQIVERQMDLIDLMCSQNDAEGALQ